MKKSAANYLIKIPISVNVEAPRHFAEHRLYRGELPVITRDRGLDEFKQIIDSSFDGLRCGCIILFLLCGSKAEADEVRHGAFPERHEIEVSITVYSGAEVEGSQSSDEFVREYSKADLSQEVPPNPARTIGDFVGESLLRLQHDFWSAHREGSAARKQLDKHMKQDYEKSHYGLSLAAMKKAKTKDTDFGLLSEHMTNQSRQSATRIVSKELTWIKQFEGGLTFDTASDTSSSAIKAPSGALRVDFRGNHFQI